MAKIETENYERIPFPIKAVRVTEENLEDIAKWAKGTLGTDDKGRQYVEVEVKRPIHENQKFAYIGDWLTTSGSGYKVYLDDAFKRCFRLVPKEVADPGDLKKLQEHYTNPGPQPVEVKAAAVSESFAHISGTKVPRD